jgi:glycosyltransferase involved in cell wall biosynthesis
MKVALVIPGGVDQSGEYRVIPALLALLKRLSAEHSVHVFPLVQAPAPGEWVLCGARVHNVGAGLAPLKVVAAILKEHRVARFDIVHSIFSGSCGLAAVAVGYLLGIPCLVHVAGGELVALPDIQYGGRLKWRGRLREAFTLRRADVVTAASAFILKQIQAVGYHGQRVPLGVDLQEWPPSSPVSRAAGAQVRLVQVASLNRVKDHATLLRALASLANSAIDFRMDVIGEDTLGGAVQAMAAELELNDRVTFHGFLTQKQSRPLVQRAHINIVSSLHEAGPLAMLEAAVQGVPTVGTAVGHVTEWAPAAAVCVPVADPVALAAGIRQLIADEAMRMRIADCAWRRALVEDADYTANRFLQIYGELTTR